MRCVMQLSPGRSQTSRFMVYLPQLALVIGVVTLAVFSTVPNLAFAQRGRRIEQLQRDQESRAEKLGGDRERYQPPRPNPAEPALAAWIDQLAAVIPRTAAGFSAEKVDDFRKANDATERWAAELVRFDNSPRANEMLPACEALLNAKDRVDRLLNQTLELRVGFAAIDAEPRHDAINNFLATTSGLIDLSGRLRYMAFDALTFTADELASVPGMQEQLLDALLRRQIGRAHV